MVIVFILVQTAQILNEKQVIWSMKIKK